MKELLSVLAGLALLFMLLPTASFAQSQRNPCFIDTKGGCTPVGTADPMPTTSVPSSSGGLIPNSSSALAANQTIKASSGNLYSFEVSADNTLSAAPWWIMIYDATSAPGDGAITPLKCYAIPSNTSFFTAAWLTPIKFVNGLIIGVSTTGCYTKTASIHAFISGDAQ